MEKPERDADLTLRIGREIFLLSYAGAEICGFYYSYRFLPVASLTEKGPVRSSREPFFVGELAPGQGPGLGCADPAYESCHCTECRRRDTPCEHVRACCRFGLLSSDELFGEDAATLAAEAEALDLVGVKMVRPPSVLDQLTPKDN